MATRDEILRELGLAPTWRLRGSGPHDPSAQIKPASTAAAEVPPRAPPRAMVAIAREPDPGFAIEEDTESPRLRSPREFEGDARTDDPQRLARIAALTWPELAPDIDACTACALCRTRRKSVPGVGDTKAAWLFVGEGPGAEEDAKGEPFVGQAGRLLDNMLAALGMNRHQNVYIANVVKCRPPNNRTPEPGEAAACRPYLERQIDLLRPSIIVALGKSAATLLLGGEASVASLRGRVHRCHGIPLVVTYHPAYLLRSLTEKAKAWEDLLFARRTIKAARTAQPGS